MAEYIIESSRSFVPCVKKGLCRLNSTGEVSGCTLMTGDKSKYYSDGKEKQNIGRGFCLAGLERETIKVETVLEKCNFEEDITMFCR